MTNIFELQKEIKEIDADIKKNVEEHTKLIESLKSRQSKLRTTLSNHLKGLDADKIDIGRTLVYVDGEVSTALRKQVVKEAIEELLENKGKFFSTQYMGIKIYSGFGEQGSDHEYGMGPTYGSIVFEIGFNRSFRGAKSIPDSVIEAAIYYLANIQK